jgi:hypothetical protein
MDPKRGFPEGRDMDGYSLHDTTRNRTDGIRDRGVIRNAQSCMQAFGNLRVVCGDRCAYGD